MAMVSEAPFMLRLVSSSVAVANRAGKLIRSILKSGNLDIVNKAGDVHKDFDPQTEADRAAQTCIIGSLQSHFPKVTIVGEEGDCTSSSGDFVEMAFDQEVLKHQCPEKLKSIKEEDVIIWVDPLDGTREFTEGLLDNVTVLIGVSYEGQAVAGVIHQPFYGYKTMKVEEQGRTMWGIVGLGSFGIQNIAPPAGRRFITTTRSHSSKINLAAIEAMKPDQIVRAGGAGNKALLVIEGNVDAYVYASSGCKRWDTCACEAILHAIGGKLTDICGSPISYQLGDNYVNKLGVLASLADHDYYMSRVPKDVIEEIQHKAEKK